MMAGAAREVVIAGKQAPFVNILSPHAVKDFAGLSR
jgi:hypothetical protein